VVSVSVETAEMTDARLRRVIAEAELKVYSGRYEWTEFPLEGFPGKANADALALVRDDEIWSQLVPSRGQSREQLALFRFHFPSDSDNSGFVGWLASLLKNRFGTGVVVTCGYNGQAGGVYDYWACPFSLGESVIAEIRRLRGETAQD